MPITSLTDITQFPVHVLDYITRQALETNAFAQSGILTAPHAEVQAMLNGGDSVTFLFWNDLSGSGQILDESTDLIVGKVVSDKGGNSGGVDQPTTAAADFEKRRTGCFALK